jgi:sterol desaturase/sphingolipid hydroxylase (fatty acid hydroxylase superfamily)
MISGRSLIYFISINCIFMGVGSIDYYLHINYSIYTMFFSILLKNIGLPILLLNVSKSESYILEGERDTDVISISNIKHIVSTSLFQFTSMSVLLYFVKPTESVFYEVIFFIPNTFIFEVVFDFFHYASHRFLHSIPILYKTIHKYHHQTLTISILTTFHHTTSDLILSNLIPIVCTLYLYPMSQWTFFTWLWYKSIVEMGGHSGKQGKSSSFPQCIWIPRFLGIEMYSRNHNMHHVNPGVNFSKRFSLWDKVFNTFSNGSHSKTNGLLSD